MNKQKLIRFEDSADIFGCPICKEKLSLQGTSLICKNKHCYDVSKFGYVNFLLNAKKQKVYDKSSFQNRRYILEHGMYEPILNEIIQFINQTASICIILDVGCGEGFYSNQIYQQTHKNIYAFDISKDSVQLASRNGSDSFIKWFVADLASIPLQDNSVDCILDIFSPANYKEFQRILAQNGYIIKVVPTTEHLKEIREKVKDQLKNRDYSNQQVIDYFEKSFTCISRKKVTDRFQITAEERKAFIEMTPLLFHVDKDLINWLDITQLTIEAEVLIGTC